MSKSVRTYQRQIAHLKWLLASVQWVQPTYNGSPSCSGCGAQEHWGCEAGCEVAAITGNRGKPESDESPSLEQHP